MEESLEDSKAATTVCEISNACVFEAPEGELEEAIAKVWIKAFRIEKISRCDNFFELGGDSLMAMSLTELLSQNLSIQIPVVDLFRNPTVRELAQWVGSPARS